MIYGKMRIQIVCDDSDMKTEKKYVYWLIKCISIIQQ